MRVGNQKRRPSRRMLESSAVWLEEFSNIGEIKGILGGQFGTFASLLGNGWIFVDEMSDKLNGVIHKLDRKDIGITGISSAKIDQLVVELRIIQDG